MSENKTWWRPTWWILAVVVVVVAGGVVAGLLVFGSDDDGRQPLVDPEVLVTARQEATNFFTLDHAKAEEDVDRVLGLATGPFKEQYTASKAQLLAKLTAQKVVCTASIPKDGAAVEFVDGDKAQVLVVIDVADTTSCGLFSPSNRTRVLLTRVDGRWLVSDLKQVG